VNFKKTPLSQRRSEPSSSKPVLGVLVSSFVIGFALSCFTANAARIPARAGIQSDLFSKDVGSGFEEPFQLDVRLRGPAHALNDQVGLARAGGAPQLLEKPGRIIIQ
jgi:hypothetical protein